MILHGLTFKSVPLLFKSLDEMVIGTNIVFKYDNVWKTIFDKLGLKVSANNVEPIKCYNFLKNGDYIKQHIFSDIENPRHVNSVYSWVNKKMW